MGTLTSAEITSMRATVSSTQFDHLCTFERSQVTGTDPDGAPIITWSDYMPDTPCHFWETMDEEIDQDETVLVRHRRLVLGANADVTNNDRIKSITGYDGRVIIGSQDIEEVIWQVNHTLLGLEDID